MKEHVSTKARYLIEFLVSESVVYESGETRDAGGEPLQQQLELRVSALPVTAAPVAGRHGPRRTSRHDLVGQLA